MNKKIIFFDIDGTLLIEETHKIPNSAKEAIKKAQENGHVVFINTGRPIVSLEQYIKDLGFDGYICGCGTYIEYKNELLLSKTIGNEVCKTIVKELRSHKIDGILEGKNGIYYDTDENIKSEEVLKIKKHHTDEGLYLGLTFDEDNIQFDKLTAWGNSESDFEGFIKKFKDIFEFIHRGKDFYELVPIGYSKASGIKFIIDELNIPIENTYALGDSTNDLSMLNYVKNSIAMGNSTPSILKDVSYVTKHIEEDGVKHALEHFKII